MCSDYLVLLLHVLQVVMSVLISVVICTHNRASYLVKAIQSVIDQRFPPMLSKLLLLTIARPMTQKLL